MSIEDYLTRVGACVDDEYGRRMRGQFQDNRGSSELAMLASPSSEEYEQLKRAVAIMTPGEKQSAKDLSDEQVEKIAADARVDVAILAIFFNGYAIEFTSEK